MKRRDFITLLGGAVRSIDARSVWRGHGNALRPSCTKPTGRTFDLQDHRVRAAVRQALKNVAYASRSRSRGSAGPIRAEPLYGQFDLPVRRHPIGSYEVFFVKFVLRPKELSGGLSDNDAPSRRVSDRDAGHHGSLRNAGSLNAIYP
jgi:hypothetical protein